MSVIENANGPKLHRLRKDVIAISHNERLNISINTHLTTTDFLDITLSLFTVKCFLYGKPNDSPLYVNTNSSHSLNILEQLPTMVNISLSSLSISEDEFNKAKLLYKKALKSSGFNNNLKF